MSSAHTLPAVRHAVHQDLPLFGSAASFCLGSAGLQRCRDLMGRAGPCHRFRRRLRRSLAAVQWRRVAATSPAGDDHRAYPPHDQRGYGHRGSAAAGLDLPPHRCGTSGAHQRHRGHDAHLQRSPCLAPCLCCCGSRRITVRRRVPFICPCTWPIPCCCLPRSPFARISSRAAKPSRARGALYATAAGHHGLAATLVVGVSGSLAALGDTLFPASSVRAAFAQDFSSSSRWLLRLRFLHPVTAVIAGLFICWLLLRSVARPTERTTGNRWWSCCWPCSLGLASLTWRCSLRSGCRSFICWARTCSGSPWLCLPPESALSTRRRLPDPDLSPRLKAIESGA